MFHLLCSFLAWLLLGLGVLTAKEVVIVPCDASAMNPNWFLYSPGMEEYRMSEWQFVHRELKLHGLEMRLSNLSEFDSPETTQRLLANVEKVIFNNIPSWTGHDWQKKLSWIGKDKCLLISWEPPSYMPEMYEPRILSLFKTHLTWNDSYVDHHRFFKINHPVLRPMIEYLPAFHEKKLVTQISGNKQSKHPHELYSKRRKVIEYFEKHPEFGFEFYGTGWKDLNYTNYRGSPNNKIDVLKQYRFCFCYENMSHIKGYITEKIFDCFTAGSIPIYLGASNIKKCIPKKCYIARKKFSSIGQLAKYLRKMPEKKYNRYIANIRSFLSSRKAKVFSKQRFVKAVVKRII